MLRSLFTGQTGMQAMKFQVDSISNNLSNVNTTGFKKERPDFESLFYEHKTAPGAPATNATEHPTGISVGTGVRTAATQTMHEQGNAKNTGNDLDMMIEGKGFFQVLREDGSTAYTRDGSFKLDGEGNIVTSNGRFLEPNIQVPEEATGISIREDGTVSAKLPDQVDPQQIGEIELATFVNPAGLRKEGENLYSETTASGDAQLQLAGQDGAGSIRQGFLEGSNVDVTRSLTNMISAQRAFEFNQRSITTSDQMLQTISQLVR